MSKKILSLISVVMVLAMLAACGGDGGAPATPAGDGEWKWERKIEIVCPWGAGGGADTTVRQFATQLEKELGQSVVVNNVSGAGGVSGVQYAVQQPADGYTWLLCTPSPMLAQITKATDFDVYGNITPVCNLVWDCNIFVAGKDAPYNNYKELMDYVAANPGKVQCGVMSLTGLDGACVTAAFGDKIEAVGYSEGSQLNSDVIGNHVGLACVGPAEVLAMVQSGDMKPIMTCTEKRMTIAEYANTECAGELNVDCFYGPYRGIYAKNGTPEAAIKAFEAAAQKAVASTDFQDWAKSQGLDQRTGWMDTATYQAQWTADHDELTSLFGS
ncbi:MAG: tripartite tricarboxylate transporter substrate binding protein [Angelakisella sp.]|jgi:putative tricarboxylic transport membrane protein|nr:tripartite tricarboxylate transporter substrate binding protein [Angelakisella sp.]